MAGIASLVGLYVTVTLKALGAFADRLVRAEDAPPDVEDTDLGTETK